MFLWPLLLLAVLVLVAGHIAFQIQREGVARLRAVAFLARERCPGCGEPYGLLRSRELRCILLRLGGLFGRTKVDCFEADCEGCRERVRVAVERDAVAFL
jgi:hypothetical protein